MESVVRQTEQDWQLLIHDDASSVDVRAMVEPYLHDARITFAKSTKRLGIGGNWNVCVKLCQTPLLQFLFQDDVWHPEYLAKALAAMESHPSAALVSAAHDYLFERVTLPARRSPKGEGGSGDEGRHAAQLNEGPYRHLSEFRRMHIHSGFQEGKLFLHWWLMRGMHPNVIGEPSFVLIRKTALETAEGFREDMPQFLDADAWARVLLHGDIVFLEEPLGSFRVHSEGASARNEGSGAGATDRLRSLNDLIDHTSGDMRKAAIKGRNTALVGMIRRYLERRKQGKGIGGSGSSYLKKFCLRHPLLMVRALARAMRK